MLKDVCPCKKNSNQSLINVSGINKCVDVCGLKGGDGVLSAFSTIPGRCFHSHRVLGIAMQKAVHGVTITEIIDSLYLGRELCLLFGQYTDPTSLHSWTTSIYRFPYRSSFFPYTLLISSPSWVNLMGAILSCNIHH